jgi:hypothetical protein
VTINGRQSTSTFGGNDPIAQSLAQFAAILLRSGIDSPTAERLLRRAFIVSAARSVRSTNIKATQSQIASIAGVSRLEVRRALARIETAAELRDYQSRSRIEALVHGWQTDPTFLKRNGKPEALDYRGARSKFDRLVRRYGRDVTQKALRVQLVKQGIAIDRNGQLILQRQTPLSTRTSRASADLRFIASQLANIDFELGRRAYSTRRISIRSNEKKSILAVRRVASARLETVLNSLESMSEQLQADSKGKRTTSHRLYVTTTVAIESGDPE